MGSLSVLLFFFSLLAVYNHDQASSISAYTITPSQSLKDGQNLTSKSETFELGFFNTFNSKNRYLGIWYKKVPLQTVVWVANRDSPLFDSSGVFMISKTGNLVIHNVTNHTIWSTNTSKRGENPIVEFLESGNLVLKDRNSDDYLWQSFDHPSDTLLPGMTLGWDLRNGLNRYLTSWKSSDDPSPGDYTYGIELTGYPEPVMRNGSTKYFRTGPWNGLRNSGNLELQNSINFTYNVVGNQIEAYLSYQIEDPDAVITRLTLKQFGNDGQLQRLLWVVNRSQNWLLEYPIPRDRCDFYGHCGVGGNCSTNDVRGCQCLLGFKPRSPNDWNQKDWSGGCERKISLDYCDKTDRFLKFSEVKLPDTTRTWMNMSMSLEECRDKCSNNCSCTAFTNSDIRGNGSGCAMWFGDLIDLRMLHGAGQNFYVRVTASEIEADAPNGTIKLPERRTKIKIVISISMIFTVLLTGVGIYILWRKKLRQRKVKHSSERTVHKLQHSPFELLINGKKDDLGEKKDDLDQLNFFHVDRIVKATDNFSDTRILGQGGFGCVYKGTLENGQEVAVKRLSTNSGQGVEEFKNEVILIARLQHRNLVRLLGFCIETEEKILVYEYVENKSLDAILFNRASKSILDWSKRFNIIVGISRGLLYLHQDSRFRIIHRDLKTSNILLDGELNPKISDFGMARIFGSDDSQATTKRIVGTYGYMSPEYAMDGLFSVKSDVFSFGVLVLEIISGKKSKGFYANNQLNLLGYAWKLWKAGNTLEMIDETLKDSCLQNEALRCIHIGLLCVQEQAEDRPTMSSVLSMLSNSDTTAFQQPRQPAFCFAQSSIEADSHSTPQKSCSANEITITKLEAR